jgi:hypothetical protein
MLATIEPKPAKHVIRWFLRTFGYGGITLPPLGVYILAERLGEERLVRHEQRHWVQAQEMGVLRWYAVYAWYSVRYGYRNNPLEIDARSA